MSTYTKRALTPTTTEPKIRKASVPAEPPPPPENMFTAKQYVEHQSRWSASDKAARLHYLRELLEREGSKPKTRKPTSAWEALLANF